MESKRITHTRIYNVWPNPHLKHLLWLIHPPLINWRVLSTASFTVTPPELNKQISSLPRFLHKFSDSFLFLQLFASHCRRFPFNSCSSPLDYHRGSRYDVITLWVSCILLNYFQFLWISCFVFYLCFRKLISFSFWSLFCNFLA